MVQTTLGTAEEKAINCAILMWTYSNIKFREKPSTGNRVVPCGQTDIRWSWLLLFDIYANALNEIYIVFCFQISTLLFYSVHACQFGSTMLKSIWPLPRYPLQFYTHWTLQNLWIWASVFIVTNTKGIESFRSWRSSRHSNKSVCFRKRKVHCCVYEILLLARTFSQTNRQIYLLQIQLRLDLQSSPDP